MTTRLSFLRFHFQISKNTENQNLCFPVPICQNSENRFLVIVSRYCSGNQYQFLQILDVKYSHIIDPRTLRAQNIEIGVTIISNSCTLSDALATALSINPKLTNLGTTLKFKSLVKIGDQDVVKEF